MVAPNAIFAIIAFFAVCAVYAVEATLAVDAVDIPVGVFGSVRHCLISYGFAVVSGMGTVPVPCALCIGFRFAKVKVFFITSDFLTGCRAFRPGLA